MGKKAERKKRKDLSISSSESCDETCGFGFEMRWAI